MYEDALIRRAERYLLEESLSDATLASKLHRSKEENKRLVDELLYTGIAERRNGKLSHVKNSVSSIINSKLWNSAIRL